MSTMGPYCTPKRAKEDEYGDGICECINPHDQAFTIIYHKLVFAVWCTQDVFILSSRERQFMHCLGDIMRRKPS